jgi:hypothetical protein
MGLDQFEFSLTDAKGRTHLYKGTLIPTRLGLPLGTQLLNVCTPALVGFMVSRGKAEGVDPVDIMTSISAMLQTLDVEFVQKRLLANVTRDGTPVSPDDQFDVIYAGNYTEMWLAVYEVVRYNGFLPLLDSLPSASEMMASMKTQMTSLRESAVETGSGPSSGG